MTVLHPSDPRRPVEASHANDERFDYAGTMNSDQAARAFTALGQATRLDIVRALLSDGLGGIAAGDIATRLDVPQSTLSFHLRALETAGLIGQTRHGRSLIYAPRLEMLRDLLAFLAETCCGGEPGRCDELARFLPSTREIPMTANTPVFNVLFICTRNSARSIMAEAILTRIGGGRFRAFSAGSDPSEVGPLPEVISQLSALGHDVSALRSKSWDLFTQPDAPKMDFVIALCDTLAGQACPDFGDTMMTAAWPLPDPAKFSGNAAERATLLNELYAALTRRLEIFVNLPIASLDRMALKARLDELSQPHAAAR